MTPRTIATLCILLACTLVPAGESIPTPWPNPAEQPLAVVRAREAAVFTDILDTRPVAAFRRLRGESGVSLPGTDIRVESVHDFLTALAEQRAENAWFCLTQQGAMVARQGSVLGWTFPNGSTAPGPADLTAWLRENGVQVGSDVLQERRPAPDGGEMVLFAPDRRVLLDVIEGGSDGGAWRNSFNAFRDFPGPGLGGWLNTRPLFGFLSLMTGFDFRAKMTTALTSVPAGASFELLPKDRDLGFTVRFDQVLQTELPVADDVLVARVQHDAMVEATLLPPAGLVDLLPFDSTALLLLNMDPKTLMPESCHFQSWINEYGAPTWTGTCLMPSGNSAGRSLRRLILWLEILSRATSHISVHQTESEWGDNLWEIRIQDTTIVLGIVEIAAAGRNNTFVVLSGSIRDWPDPSMLAVGPASNAAVCSWKARLAGLPERSVLTNALVEATASAHRDDLDRDFFDSVLPGEESGSLDILGRDIFVRSERGGLPLLLMALTELYAP